MEKTCSNCKHIASFKIGNEFEKYCYNPDCDIEFSNDEDCDNFMGTVDDNDSCKLFYKNK